MKRPEGEENEGVPWRNITEENEEEEEISLQKKISAIEEKEACNTEKRKRKLKKCEEENLIWNDNEVICQ